MDLFYITDETTRARGYNIYRKNLITNIKQIDENQYEAIVKGTNDYKVKVDLEDINRSKCSCLCKKKICKHIVALIYEVDSHEAYIFEQTLKQLIVEKQKYIKKINEKYNLAYNKAVDHVNSLSIEEMKKELISKLVDEDYYDDINEEDEYYEDDFEMIDEIDEDILETFNIYSIDNDSYPTHKVKEYMKAFEQILGEETFIDLRTCEVYDDCVFDAMDMEEDEIDELLSQPYIIRLPGISELDEYGDMLSFIDTIEESYIADRLIKAVNSKSVYNIFKSEIKRLNLRDKWFKFKNNCLEYKVINWLEQNNIKYEK